MKLRWNISCRLFIRNYFEERKRLSMIIFYRQGFVHMGISSELLIIGQIIFSSNLLQLLKYGAKHINETGWKIFIFNLENQFCNGALPSGDEQQFPK